jgi:hypothetical protein
MNTEERRILLAQSNGPRPGDFELGVAAVESRSQTDAAPADGGTRASK